MFAKEHLHKKIHLHWLIVQILGEKVKKKKIKKFSLSFWQMEATLDKIVCLYSKVKYIALQVYSFSATCHKVDFNWSWNITTAV